MEATLSAVRRCSAILKNEMKLSVVIAVVVLAIVIDERMAIGSPGGWCTKITVYKALTHRTLVGHAVRGLSGVSLVRCAVLCSCLKEKDSPCLSFNYGKTNRTCELNDARVEEFPESLVAESGFSYYGAETGQANSKCLGLDSKPALDPGWQIVFKGVARAGVKLYDMWTAVSWEASMMEAGRNFRDEFLHKAWRSGNLTVRRVKLSLCDFNGSRVELIFNGTGSDILNWFTKDRLLSSPWEDLRSTLVNFFSIEGDTVTGRRFFINNYYGGCLGDRGWLIVVDSMTSGCNWERPPAYPVILYSKAAGYVSWEDVVTEGANTVGCADYLTIHIDAE
ncbi:uncharacterized protein LOC110980747 [Acanthaster planci]|uniref:Uncharacterized protein LOC110980747 n=1 Tax=Acanthaster planci TaxID=133434 RepID=A0A8B7YL69_ACAPL|nr:uncharacterized protein LOC110980747 [Acanthaster planci]